MGRGPAAVSVELHTTFHETHAGEPIMLRFVQDMALQSVEYEWRFEDDHVVATTRQGGRETVKQEPLPQGSWLTPQAAHRYWLQRREAGAKEIASWDPEAEHGLFTEYFLRAVYGAADDGTYGGDGDGQVTAAEVKAYLDEEMTYAAKRAFWRKQHASLEGDAGRVLASFTPGQPPARPEIGGDAGGQVAALPPAMEFQIKIAELAKPWARARIAEGHDSEAIDEIAKHDDLMVHRTIKLVHEAYPRLFDDVIEEELADLILNGEVIQLESDHGGQRKEHRMAGKSAARPANIVRPCQG